MDIQISRFTIENWKFEIWNSKIWNLKIDHFTLLLSYCCCGGCAAVYLWYSSSTYIPRYLYQYGVQRCEQRISQRVYQVLQLAPLLWSTRFINRAQRAEHTGVQHLDTPSSPVVCHNTQEKDTEAKKMSCALEGDGVNELLLCTRTESHGHTYNTSW